ncbi:hypothetical protein M2323_002886 [Rhodoblastus acidophilus]|uniref:hypothetical protein n=1 Tax=Rhodoblastus acidophilus TaxID=1074 RepID=UPI002224DCB3|nr:hypothetical protein [Rhodoblastus acidophilus]MCW2284987.1 hypothetical protein [Rhodoblastus acidophilus]MCW2333949.1 hypothetical protein [Rhodoblastus acidophilus]
MSFGKRGVTPPQQAPAPSPDEEEPEPPITRQPRTVVTTEKLSVLDILLYGVGCIAVAACLVLYLKKTPSPPRENPVRENVVREEVAERAPPVASDYSPLDVVRINLDKGEAGRLFDFAIVAAPSARCFARLNTVRPWRHPGWTNRALDEPNRILKFQYEVAGLALSCLMTEDQRRFCKPAERAKIKKAVAFYLGKYRREVAAKNRVVKPPQDKLYRAQDEMFRTLAERIKASDPAADDDVGVDDPGELFKGIASVTDAGYFTAADFGSAPEFAPYIRPSLAKPCG